MAEVTSIDTLASTRLVLISSVSDLAMTVSIILVTNIAEASFNDTTSSPRRLVLSVVAAVLIFVRSRVTTGPSLLLPA